MSVIKGLAAIGRSGLGDTVKNVLGQKVAISEVKAEGEKERFGMALDVDKIGLAKTADKRAEEEAARAAQAHEWKSDEQARIEKKRKHLVDLNTIMPDGMVKNGMIEYLKTNGMTRPGPHGALLVSLGDLTDATDVNKMETAARESFIEHYIFDAKVKLSEVEKEMAALKEKPSWDPNNTSPKYKALLAESISIKDTITGSNNEWEASRQAEAIKASATTKSARQPHEVRNEAMSIIKDIGNINKAIYQLETVGSADDATMLLLGKMLGKEIETTKSGIENAVAEAKSMLAPLKKYLADVDPVAHAAMEKGYMFVKNDDKDGKPVWKTPDGRYVKDPDAGM